MSSHLYADCGCGCICSPCILTQTPEQWSGNQRLTLNSTNASRLQVLSMFRKAPPPRSCKKRLIRQAPTRTDGFLRTNDNDIRPSNAQTMGDDKPTSRYQSDQLPRTPFLDSLRVANQPVVCPINQHKRIPRQEDQSVF